MRYEIKLQVSTELDVEVVKNTIKSMERSGKVEVHWMRSQSIGPIGRPAEVGAEILAELQEHDYPRSAKQLGFSLQRSATSLYRVLYGLVEEGKLGMVVDERWNSKRFGDEHQLKKWAEKMKRREVKELAEKMLADQTSAGGMTGGFGEGSGED